MKNYFTFFIILFSFYCSQSQSVFNAELIRKLETESLTNNMTVLVLVKPNYKLVLKETINSNIHYKIGNIYSLSTSLNELKNLSKQKEVLRVEYTQHHLTLLDDTSDVRNRIKDIKLGLPPLTQSYDGTDVIIGIIDSGADFNHPDLKTSTGNSRIKFLWDMTKPVAVNTPSVFGYGQEWTNTEIDLGLCTHDDSPYFGHGTASAGISAGNGLAINKYAGVAPKADLIVVAVDFNRSGSTIADAVQYIVTKSAQLDKPFVINASLGDYYGSHDGTDLEAQLIDGMIAGPGKCMVASAGNAGSVPFHVGYNTTSLDTNFTWIKSTNANIYVSEYADTAQIKNVKYTIGVTNLGFTSIGNIGFKNYNYALNTLKRDTIFRGLNRIGIIESISSINTFGVFELNFWIRADSLNYLWSLEHNGTGRIDSWNFDYLTTGLPNQTVYSKINKYKKADTIQTIVSGFQCSEEVITVANYVNRNIYVDVNNTQQLTTETPGEIATSSSVGPSRNNKVKPDIASTGSTLLASVDLDVIPNLIINFPSAVAQGSFHITVGGTSSSSPVVAGFAALYLQKNPTATNKQIKQAITNCAFTDAFVSLPVPNYRWGYGKLDGHKAMSCLNPPLSTNINFIEETQKMSVFPNPIENEATILFENNLPKTIKLINTTGQILLVETVNTSIYVLNCKNLASGVYLLISEEKNKVNKIKILVL